MSRLLKTSASILVASGLQFSAAAPAASATHALVIGIDRYQELRNLKGAAADANDIATALRSLNVDVALLTDAQVNRDAIFQSWRRMVERSASGDILILSIAGHGSQEKARHPNSESDGRDEVFVLGGFTRARPGNAQRIFDDEFYELFSAVPKDRTIIFVADTCHSGTMFRSADSRVMLGETRFTDYGVIEDDALPPPSPDRPIERSDLPNLFFYSSSTDREATPEVGIDGRYRGALSWAFARALEGHADINRDRSVTHAELQDFLYQRVKELSGERQHPRAEPLGRGEELVIALPGSDTGQGNIAAPPIVDLQIAAFNAAGDVGPDWFANLALTRARHVTRESQPDLVIDIEKREVLSASGDVVATDVLLNKETLDPICQKWRMIKSFRTSMQSSSLRVDLFPHDGRHKQGDVLQVTVTGGRYSHVVVYALSGDGTFNMLFPLRRESAEVGQRTLSFKVTPLPPFGADHVFAISTDIMAASLVERLYDYDGKRIDDRLVSDLSRISGSHQVGLQAIYTYGG